MESARTGRAGPAETTVQPLLHGYGPSEKHGDVAWIEAGGRGSGTERGRRQRIGDRVRRKAAEDRELGEAGGRGSGIEWGRRQRIGDRVRPEAEDQGSSEERRQRIRDRVRKGGRGSGIE